VRILLITQWFEPEPMLKGLLLARELRGLGYEVEVLTGFPNYPGGVLYPGYRIKLLQTEIIEGIRVTRVPLYPSHSSSAIGRILNYVSFAAAAAVYGAFNRKKFDVAYVYHPPLTVGMAAAVIGLVHRMPFVYDIQDLWPDTLKSTGMISNRHALAMVARACQFVYRRASAVIAQSPGFERRLLDRGVPREKLHMIYNWCDEAALAIEPSEATMPPGMAGRFNIVFAGNMGPAQALDTVLLAARDAHAVDPRIQFVFVGGGVHAPLLQERAEAQGLGNAVMFLPRMPIDKVGEVLQAADVLLVHLRDDPLFSITVPSKTQAYLFSGKPVLMAVHGDAADLVKQAGAGICAEPENAESIAQAALRFASMEREALFGMGRRGQTFYEQNLSVKVGIAKLAALLEQAGKSNSEKRAKRSTERPPAASTPSQNQAGNVQR
jgi:glycosyltransferase involved in cell wall biosynthesis